MRTEVSHIDRQVFAVRVDCCHPCNWWVIRLTVEPNTLSLLFVVNMLSEVFVGLCSSLTVWLFLPFATL